MTAPPEQAEAVAFLRQLAGSEPLETHISLVFVGADTVWKLKKAVRLAFLDFTPLEARRRFILRELELNRGAASGLYRDVVPVVRRPDGTLGLGEAEEGPAIDWVLRMARVPAEDFLDTVAAAGGLTPELLDELGDAVAAFHCRLPPLTETDPVAAMRHVAEGNAQSAHDAGLAGTHPCRAGRHCALACAARARWFRPSRTWRSASRKSLPLAGSPRPVRCAGIRRGDGDDRSGLRSRVPADGS